MVEESLTSSIVHRENGTRTIFLYFSTTNSITQRIDNDKSMCHDYTHMITDMVVSSRVSNNWLRTLENIVGCYIELGPIFSDLVSITNNNRGEIVSSIGVDKGSKVVSFLDHTVGYRGVMTSDAYIEFVEGMLLLAKEHQDVCFLFKSKKSLSELETQIGQKVWVLIDSLKKTPNCFFANELFMSSFDVIGISDLVVSAPMSSVIYEALCGGVKTISFDPLSQYKEYDVITNKFPKFNAHNYGELKKLFEYWIFQFKDESFDIFMGNYIRKNIDQKCCKNSMIARFNQILHTKTVDLVCESSD